MKKVFTLLLFFYLSADIFAQAPFTIDQLSGKTIGGSNEGMGSSFRTPTAGNLTYVTVINRSSFGDAVNSTLEIYKGNGLNTDSLIHQESFIAEFLYSNKRISIKLNQPLPLASNQTYTLYIKGFALTYTNTNTYSDGTMWDKGVEYTNRDLGFILHFNTPGKEMSLSNTSVNENSPVGLEIGILSISNISNPITYKFIRNGLASTDTSSLKIEGNKILVRTSPDYEVKNSYKLRIQALVEDIAVEKEFTITVKNVVETPANLALSKNTISENNTTGTTIGTLTATDPEKGTLTYSLVPGAGDNASFSMSNNQLKINITTDFETKNSYTVRVKVTNQEGQSLEKDFSIDVLNVNEGPTNILLSNNVIDENNAIGTFVGSLSAVDPDNINTFTFSLPANELDNESFLIEEDKLLIAEVTNYKNKNLYTIKVIVKDQEDLSFERNFNITVEENPTTNVIDKSLFKNIQIYPNPAKENVTINLDGPAFISIHSLSGQVVKEWNHESNVVPVTDISSGLYLVKITRNNEVETRKLTIE